VKLTSETEMVHVNGKKVGENDAVTKFTAYVSPYFVVSNGGAYTKHIYAASQRIASKLGNEDGFGADPRRVEQAGGKKISDFQQGNVGERFKALGYEYSAPEKEKVEKDSSMDSEAEEKLIFFYHPDHLGSTSYVTDADGNIAQHVEYIPYGEVFVEERNNSFSTNYLFNAKELDNETGLYYYGARYLDPTGAMWLSVDPMWEKYAGMSPYNYCAGNPVKLVDPDGNEIRFFGVDRKGGTYEIGKRDSELNQTYVVARGSDTEKYIKSETKAGRDYVGSLDPNECVLIPNNTVKNAMAKSAESSTGKKIENGGHALKNGLTFQWKKGNEPYWTEEGSLKASIKPFRLEDGTIAKYNEEELAYTWHTHPYLAMKNPITELTYYGGECFPSKADKETMGSHSKAYHMIISFDNNRNPEYVGFYNGKGFILRIKYTEFMNNLKSE